MPRSFTQSRRKREVERDETSIGNGCRGASPSQDGRERLSVMKRASETDAEELHPVKTEERG